MSPSTFALDIDCDVLLSLSVKGWGFIWICVNLCLLMHWLRSQLVLFSSQLWVTAIHRRSRISLDMRVSFISMSCSSTWNLTLMLYSSSCHNFQRPHLATPTIQGLDIKPKHISINTIFGTFWIKKMQKNIGFLVNVKMLIFFTNFWQFFKAIKENIKLLAFRELKITNIEPLILWSSEVVQIFDYKILLSSLVWFHCEFHIHIFLSKVKHTYVHQKIFYFESNRVNFILAFFSSQESQPVAKSPSWSSVVGLDGWYPFNGRAAI